MRRPRVRRAAAFSLCTLMVALATATGPAASAARPDAVPPTTVGASPLPTSTTAPAAPSPTSTTAPAAPSPTSSTAPPSAPPPQSTVAPAAEPSPQSRRGKVEKAEKPIAGSYIVELEPGDPGWVGIRSLVLADRHGGEVGHLYEHAIQGFSVRMSADDAAALAAEPGVAAVAEDGEVHVDTTQPSPQAWGLDRIDERDLPLDNAYVHPTGAPAVRVYVLDTAVRLTHREFGGRAASGWDFVDGDADANDTCTGSSPTGHGTHVAGTIGGANYGVAKGVQIVAVRVLGCTGSGSFSNVLAGVEWVTAHAVKPAVANMSLGGNGTNSPLEDAIRASVEAGITYVVAAGNGNGADACNETPARTPQVLTVGSTTSTDARSSFSNVGPCIDLFAPGTGILSAWRTDDTATRTVNGTSMASPHVAGVAAQFLQRNPGATPAQVASAITTNASSGKVSDPGTGSPNLLVFAGFVAAAAPDPPALTGVSRGANGAVQLSWSVPIDGGSPITAYRVFRGTTPGGEGPVPIATLGAGVTSTTDAAVTDGTTYYYQVSAVNALGETRSAERSVLPESPVLAVVRGGDNGLWWRQSNGADAWSAWQSLGGSITSSPTLVSDAVGSWVFARAADNGLWTRRFVGGSWQAWQSLGGTITSDPAAVAVGSVVHVFVRGEDSALWTRRFDGTSWSLWWWLEGTITSDPTATVAGSVVHLLARGADNGVWTRRLSGGAWSPWQSLGGWTTSNPMAVAAGSQVHLFARAIDNAMWTRRFDGSSWQPWQWLEGTITSDPTAAVAGSVVHMFARGADNGVWTRRFSGGAWSPWQSLGGWTTSNPMAVAAGSQVHLFARAIDNGLWTRRFVGGSWSEWLSLGGVVTSDPAAVVG